MPCQLPQGRRSGWVSRMVRIIEVDPRDEAGLRAFHDTEQAAIRHDRPEAALGFRVVERMHEMQRREA